MGFMSNFDTIMTENIIVANLKCGGCASSIKNKLKELHGIDSINVDLDSNNITIIHQGIVNRDTIAAQLKSIGYPEATEENGLLLQLKSYASCMIGKLSSEN
jgi:copper chaperone CopZ